MKTPTTLEIPLAQIEDNPLSANEEDSATFERLKKQIEENGLLELPVVVALPSSGEIGQLSLTKYRLIAGHHKRRAWAELGHDRIPCIIAEPQATAEAEFNLVNNMNVVRGRTRTPKLLEIVRAQELDPTKLDIFKTPSASLMPTVDQGAIAQQADEAKRKAQLHNLTLKIAQEIGEAILSGKDDLLTLLVVEDKLAAVLRIPFKSGAAARKNAGPLQALLAKALEPYEDGTTPTAAPEPPATPDQPAPKRRGRPRKAK